MTARNKSKAGKKTLPDTNCSVIGVPKIRINPMYRQTKERKMGDTEFCQKTSRSERNYDN